MNKTSYQILPTKLNRPHLPSNIILRSDLIEILNHSFFKRLVLISAPAGFGKSTLINSWLGQQSRPTAWLSLDKADNDPSRFFTYFFYAISQIYPDMDLDFIENNNFKNNPTVEDILTSLIHQLDHTFTKCIFVLDDYHLIRNPIVHDTVQFLIRNLTYLSENAEDERGVLPVIISRSDPPFPLSKWRLQGEITEIRMDDLRISQKDAKIFLHHATGVAISEKEAGELVSQTEGWIAGLQMAAIAFNEQKLNSLDQFIPQFNGGNHLIADYLLNEVISLLSENIQQFMVQTSILERFSGPLCDEILGTTDSQAILESLENANLFIIPLDDQRTWYRYHHLLSEYLNKRRVQFPKDSFTHLHLKAAAWFETNKYLDESIQHFLAVGRVEEAVRIITDNASSLLNQGKIYYLGELIAYFPEDAFDRWPWLCIYRGWKDAIMELGEDEFWMNKAEQVIAQNNHPPYVRPGEINEMLGNIAAIRAMSAAKRGDIETTFSVAPQALSLLPKPTAKVRGLVLHAQGYCQYLNGQLPEAQTTFFNARDELNIGGNVSASAESTWMAGEIAYIHGKLHLAEDILKEPVSFANVQKNDYCYSFQSYSGLGKIYYEWNLINRAITNLQRGYSDSKQFSLSSRVNSGIALANVYLNLKDWGKAETILEELDYTPSRFRTQPIVESVWSAGWIRYYAFTSHFRQAERLLEKLGRNLNEVSLYREPEMLALLDYYQQTGQSRETIQVSEILIQILRKSGRNNSLIRVLIFQANAYFAVGDTKKALDLVIQALSLGRLEGYLRSFMDGGDSIFKLLMELATQENTNSSSAGDLEYIHEIITASLNNNSIPQYHLASKPFTAVKPEGLLAVFDNPLTPPELSILHLLVAGYNNYEIASCQHISINTVKTHISHIFGKLGVHNRIQATNRAKILGLV